MRYTVSILASLTLAIPLSAAVQPRGTVEVGAIPSAFRPIAAADDDDENTVVSVDCNRHQTISQALQKGSNKRPLVIHFTGTCTENPVVNRDDVEISGLGSSSVLVGLMDVRGASRVFVHDFNATGIPGGLFDLDHGAVNAIQGSSVTIMNINVSNTKARGIQVDHSQAVIGNVSVNGGMAGAFVFRAAAIFFNGNITATNSLFGMSLLYSASTAKGPNFTFDHDVFSLLIQAGSTFEHVQGNLVVNNSSVLGIGVFGQGVFAYGSFIQAHNNQNTAFEVDELSSFSPLIGAPGGGPSVTITDNPAVGISVERGSTFELATAATIQRNNIGLQVDGGSYLRMSNATITDNTAADVKLSFGSKAEFNTANTVGTPVQCDSTVITRGAFGCGGH